MAITLLAQGRGYKRLQTDAISTLATNSSDSIAVDDMLCGAVQVVHAGHTISTCTYKLQHSLDGGVNWDDSDFAAVTTSGVSGSNTFLCDPLPGGLIRVIVSVANVGSSSPTITVYFSGKRL